MSPFRDAQAQRRRRIDLHPAAPHRARDRIGHLLQPRQMRRRTVAELRRGVRQEVERILLRVAIELRRRRTRPRSRRAATEPPASRLAAADVPHQPPFPAPPSTHRRLRPRRKRRERRAKHLLERLPRQVHRLRQPPPDLEQHVRHRARLVQRPHDRGATLTTGTQRPRFRHGIDPRLEERVIGKNQIRQRARLVEEAAEAGDERHLREGLANLPGTRRREHGFAPSSSSTCGGEAAARRATSDGAACPAAVWLPLRCRAAPALRRKARTPQAAA